MSELTSELGKMRSEISAATDEQSTFLAYDKRVKGSKSWSNREKKGKIFKFHFFFPETASELTELQSQLADYNLLVDKMNTDTEVILVQQEAQEMASQNEADSREVDGLFAEKQARQDQIQRLEQEVRIGESNLTR